VVLEVKHVNGQTQLAHFLKVMLSWMFSGLELGQLLHDDLFGLFEAMSAIEMMDPKMDAGMLCNRGSKAALNFDQAVEVW
jgi:hypothetical protein